MVVRDLHIVRGAFPPAKAYPILIVDTDAVLAFSVSLESFQMVARGNTQVAQSDGGIEQEQFPKRHDCDTAPLRDPSFVEEIFGVPVPEGTDHS